MKKFSLLLCAFILVLAGSAYAKGRPVPSCYDVPITVTFLATLPAAAISNDVNQVYQGGVDGVENTQIHIGGDCNGSRDATLLPSRADRKKPAIRQFQLQFANAISGSIIPGQGGQPSFAGTGTTFLSPGFMNIRNILGYGVVIPPTYPSTATYYTRMTLQFLGTDGNSYRLPFYPDDLGTCPVPGACVPDRTGNGDPPSRNTPETAAWVKVTWTPRNPGDSTSRDQWDVEGMLNVDNEVIGTLFDDNGVHRGQYSMPFSIRVRALTSLPQ